MKYTLANQWMLLMGTGSNIAAQADANETFVLHRGNNAAGSLQLTSR